MTGGRPDPAGRVRSTRRQRLVALLRRHPAAVGVSIVLLLVGLVVLGMLTTTSPPCEAGRSCGESYWH